MLQNSLGEKRAALPARIHCAQNATSRPSSLPLVFFRKPTSC